MARTLSLLACSLISMFVTVACKQGVRSSAVVDEYGEEAARETLALKYPGLTEKIKSIFKAKRSGWILSVAHPMEDQPATFWIYSIDVPPTHTGVRLPVERWKQYWVLPISAPGIEQGGRWGGEWLSEAEFKALSAVPTGAGVRVESQILKDVIRTKFIPPKAATWRAGGFTLARATMNLVSFKFESPPEAPDPRSFLVGMDVFVDQDGRASARHDDVVLVD